ncbi:MAG: hypothetical protein IPL32_00300 [Chloracidobacterium sp.]|nr:hypothetical protein [Chloracidobacterium sp.]
MDLLHVHLLLNHFPVIGTIIGIALLLFGFVSKSDLLKRASLAMFFVLALLTIAVFLTGEPAEERVEKSAGVSKVLMEEHEEAALPALIGMEVTGCIALIGLFVSFRKSKFANIGFAAAMVLSIVTFGLMARTANLGGQIRHAEIRSGTAGPGNENPAATKSKKDDDDDKD